VLREKDQSIELVIVVFFWMCCVCQETGHEMLEASTFMMRSDWLK